MKGVEVSKGVVQSRANVSSLHGIIDKGSDETADSEMDRPRGFQGMVEKHCQAFLPRGMIKATW